MSNKAIVLDANILIRAVLGSRAQRIIIENAKSVRFFTPAVAYDDARKYLPALFEKRGIDGAVALKVLDALEAVVQPLEAELYDSFQRGT